MNSADLKTALAQVKAEVDKALAELMGAEEGIPGRLREAMTYSLLAGGKRLRPVLLLWTWQAVAGRSSRQIPDPTADVMRAACALECLHTYSLIHDDLPAMDDDTLRRGRPTCHVAFDEATAILAGDGLQALGFAWLAQACGEKARAVIAKVARAVGPAGMVGGQQLDLAAEGKTVTREDVARIHSLKTGGLLAVSLATGAALAGANDSVLSDLHHAGLELGLAFQGADDLLDLGGASEVLGKTAGKDEAAGKATWIRVVGEGEARRITAEHGRGGRDILARLLPDNPATSRLLALASFLWQREA